MCRQMHRPKPRHLSQIFFVALSLLGGTLTALSTASAEERLDSAGLKVQLEKAEAGDVAAENALGTEVDPQKAMAWYQKASKGGNYYM